MLRPLLHPTDLRYGLVMVVVTAVAALAVATGGFSSVTGVFSKAAAEVAAELVARDLAAEVVAEVVAADVVVAEVVADSFNREAMCLYGRR